MKIENLKKGIHSLTVKGSKIRVESNFGRESMVSTYNLDEYEKALQVFTRLTNNLAD